MGRTRRRRRRRRCRALSAECGYRLGKNEAEGDAFASLVVWMSKLGWEPTRKIVPAVFPATGRGLMAKEKIDCDDVIVKIPGNLLITVKSVSDSKIGGLFNNKKPFTAQQVITVFLMWQKHEGAGAFWYKYISSLPEKVNSPIHLTDGELELLPKFIIDPIKSLKVNINELFEDFIKTLTNTDICEHCDTEFYNIFTLKEFVWAWSMVNSRAVYISPDQNTQHLVNISDVNSLAMAPYLDMFNHSCKAKVKAFIDVNDGSYQIKTAVPFQKSGQVFINYGSHSNLKLFLEYGFILTDNHNDAIAVSYEELYKEITQLFPPNKLFTLDVMDKRYKFLKVHDLLSNFYLYADGLSWNIKIVTYVLASPDDVLPKTMQLKVFSSDFNEDDLRVISCVGLRVVEAKLMEYKCVLERLENGMRTLYPGIECLKMSCELFKEYIRVLNGCHDCLSKCV